MGVPSLPSPSSATHSVRAYARSHTGRHAPRPDPDGSPAGRPYWKDAFHPKLFSTLTRAYWRTHFAKDVMAGVIVGIVALPLAIAFAVASGVSPEKGLATAIVAGFLVSFLGGSRVQIGGPTGAFIVIVAGVVAQYGPGGLMVATMMAGVFLVGFGLLRLGSVIKFIPHAVIVGFTSGIAVTIFSTQVPDALGLTLAEAPERFLAKWRAYLGALGTAEGWSAALTGATALIIVLGRRWLPRIPGSLIAILLTTAAAALWRLPVDTIGSRFGELSGTFSFAWPAVSWGDLPRYVQPAFTIALLGAIESLLSAVVADGMIAGKHRSNTELIAQGVANLVTPLVGGIPATGAIARTVTNVKSGGVTPVAGLVHALTLLAIALALGKYARLIPMPCLAGILLVVAYNMSEWRSFAALLKAPAQEVAVLLSTFVLTVLVDLTVAIQVGMVLAAFLFMRRMANLGTVFNVSGGGAEGRENVDEYAGLPSGVDVFEISGPFFFAAAQRYQQVLMELGKESRLVIVRMRHVPFIDVTGLRTFKEAVAFMQRAHRTVLLSGVRPSVSVDLRKYGLAAMVGEDHIFPHFDAALAHVREHLAEGAAGEDGGAARPNAPATDHADQPL